MICHREWVIEMGGEIHCYARGYPGVPFSGDVHVYGNLPEKLAETRH
ncbi:MAG: hypothetical protein PVG99_09680 [Desulfobacteraceae bacterium]|jgi:hypothetical protein